MGSTLAGWSTRCAVEIDSYCRKVLLARQRDGILDRFPIWDDVCTFDGRPWRGQIDIVTGGFPCQDVSSASSDKNRKGLNGERSGLWREYRRVLEEVQPVWALIENSDMLRGRGLSVVLRDLSEVGYDAVWGVFPATACGAPHKRARMWILAHSNNKEQREQPEHVEVAGASKSERTEVGLKEWWPLNSIEGVDDGLANRMDRIRATGNGQVAPLVPVVFNTLKALFQ